MRAQLLGCYEIPQHCIRQPSDVAHSSVNRPSADESALLLPEALTERDDGTETEEEQLQPTVSGVSGVSASPGVRVERGEELLL